MERGRVVEDAVGDYGKPGAVETLRVTFHNFASLPHDVGDETDGSDKELHGLKWYVWICTGGDEEETVERMALPPRSW